MFIVVVLCENDWSMDLHLCTVQFLVVQLSFLQHQNMGGTYILMELWWKPAKHTQKLIHFNFYQYEFRIIFWNKQFLWDAFKHSFHVKKILTFRNYLHSRIIPIDCVAHKTSHNIAFRAFELWIFPIFHWHHFLRELYIFIFLHRTVYFLL